MYVGVVQLSQKLKSKFFENISLNPQFPSWLLHPKKDSNNVEVCLWGLNSVTLFQILEQQKQISYNWNWRLPNWILTCSRWPSPRKTKAEKWSTTLKSLLNDNIDCTKSWVGPPTSFPRSENWPQFQLITSKSHQVLNGFSYLDDPIGNDLLDIYFFLLVKRETFF